MKTCTLFNVPESIARLVLSEMKDLIVDKINRDEFDEVETLLWYLQRMIESVEEAGE